MIWTGLWGLPVGVALGLLQLWLLKRSLALPARLSAMRILGKFALSLFVMVLVGALNYWALIFVALGYMVSQVALLLWQRGQNKKEDG